MLSIGGSTVHINPKLIRGDMKMRIKYLFLYTLITVIMILAAPKIYAETSDIDTGSVPRIVNLDVIYDLANYLTALYPPIYNVYTFETLNERDKWPKVSRGYGFINIEGDNNIAGAVLDGPYMYIFGEWVEIPITAQ